MYIHVYLQILLSRTGSAVPPEDGPNHSGTVAVSNGKTTADQKGTISNHTNNREGKYEIASETSSVCNSRYTYMYIVCEHIL